MMRRFFLCQINMAFSLGKNQGNNINNEEFSQIKVNKKRKSNLNNLWGENEKEKKDIVDTEGLPNMIGKIIIDKNKCFQNIKKVASEFFNYSENINNYKKNTQTLDETIKKLNELFFEMNTKTNSFNELSECFNKVKNQLLDCKNNIKRKLDLMLFICEENVFTLINIQMKNKYIYLIKKCSKKQVIN